MNCGNVGYGAPTSETGSGIEKRFLAVGGFRLATLHPLFDLNLQGIYVWEIILFFHYGRMSGLQRHLAETGSGIKMCFVAVGIARLERVQSPCYLCLNCVCIGVGYNSIFPLWVTLTVAMSGMERHPAKPEVVLKRGLFLSVALVWSKISFVYNTFSDYR